MPHQTNKINLGGLKHGAAAQKLFLPNESSDLFFFSLQNAFELFAPSNERDAAFVANAVRARWLFCRAERAHNDGDSILRLLKPDVASWTMQDTHRLELLKRYRTRAERALARALNHLNYICDDAQYPRPWHEWYAAYKLRFEREANLHKKSSTVT